MTVPSRSEARPGHRLAAAGALVTATAAPIAAAVFLLDDVVVLLFAVLGAAVAVGAGWVALTRRGRRRVVAAVTAVGALAVVAVGFVIALRLREALGGLALVVLLVVATVLLTHVALGRGRRLRGGPARAHRVAPGVRPVLLMNPHSGGGKVDRFDLTGECRRRGIEPIVLGDGDDFREAALAAVRAGAGVLGAAGGDGTQACVAAVAAEHDLPFVCVPAGTRNHFAFDLGVDRDDVLASLDAFVDGVEQRVDLATVNDRVFVNNVSLGVYGEIVQSDEYRDAKVRTAIDRLPDLLGPDGDAPELRCTGPDGASRSTRQLVLVSNNAYELERMSGFGTRERLDTGLLGVTVLTVDSPTEAATLTALGLAGQVARFAGYEAWTVRELQVEADRTVAAGIDGEFLDLEPPLRFSVRPGALRVRLARHAPGASPAATVARPDRATLAALVRVARGDASERATGAGG